MRVAVNFTIDVPADSLPALRELAGGVDTNDEARAFVKADAAWYCVGYLQDNGVSGARLIREDGQPVD